jgi:ABC-2 type transport system ATP-binding protein
MEEDMENPRDHETGISPDDRFPPVEFPNGGPPVDAPTASAPAVPAVMPILHDSNPPVPGPMMVQVEQVGKSFGDKVALRDISFCVPPGQICGLLGPNGAGKTTLFRLLMGILKATTGRLLVDGRDAFDDRVEAKRLIGFLPDEPIFYSYLSGREILELSSAMHGLDVGKTMTRITPLLARLRLNNDIDNYAEDYSRGMKKKLGLLLAMLHEPKLLILDEPTNGIDVESIHIFYEMIQEQAQLGRTVFFSTHLMDHVSKLCSHAVILNDGALIAQGSLQDLHTRYGQANLENLFLALTTRPPQT